VRVITLINAKGGPGKSTLSASLAVAAAEAGESVIALDLDPQRSLAMWGDKRKADTPAVDQVDAGELPDILATLANRFSVAIIDTAGTAGTATNLAVQGADLCLVPARPSWLDIQATLATVDAVRRMGKPFAFVLNQCPPTPRSRRSSEAAAGLQSLGVLANPLMTQRADYQDAIAAGLGVTEYAPAGKAAEEVRALWSWIDRTMNRSVAQSSRTTGTIIAAGLLLIVISFAVLLAL